MIEFEDKEHWKETISNLLVSTLFKQQKKKMLDDKIKAI